MAKRKKIKLEVFLTNSHNGFLDVRDYYDGARLCTVRKNKADLLERLNELKVKNFGEALNQFFLLNKMAG